MEGKQTIIIYLLIITIALTGAFGVFYLSIKTDTPPIIKEPPITTGTKPITGFPLGDDIDEGTSPLISTIGNGVNQPAATQNIVSFDPSDSSAQFISDEPVAGFIFLNTGKETAVRYIEKTTGHIKELALNERLPTKISNSTISRVQSVFWNKVGDSAILNTIESDHKQKTTYAKIIPPPEKTGIGSLSSSVINEKVLAMTSSPDGKSFFFLKESSSGGSFGQTVQANGGKLQTVKQIFVSPLREWTADWPTTSFLYLTTKPSSNVGGFLYKINIANGSFEKILGGISGLTTLTSKDGETVFYSESRGLGMTNYLFNIKEKTTITLPIQTISEKCVWSTLSKDALYCGVPTTLLSGEYPDVWHRGEIQFEDEIWKIDRKTGETKIVSGKDFDKIDAINLSLSADEQYLGFINKRNASLWILKIE